MLSLAQERHAAQGTASMVSVAAAEILRPSFVSKVFVSLDGTHKSHVDFVGNLSTVLSDIE